MGASVSSSSLLSLHFGLHVFTGFQTISKMPNAFGCRHHRQQPWHRWREGETAILSCVFCFLNLEEQNHHPLKLADPARGCDSHSVWSYQLNDWSEEDLLPAFLWQNVRGPATVFLGRYLWGAERKVIWKVIAWGFNIVMWNFWYLMSHLNRTLPAWTAAKPIHMLA